MLRRRSKKSIATVCRNYVQIQEVSSIRDSGGGRVETWSDVNGYSSVPAAIWPISSKRTAEMRSFNVRATHTIVFRGDITINVKNRIKFGTRIFDIHTADDIQTRDEEIIVNAEEKRA